jgi:beta-galactosidase
MFEALKAALSKKTPQPCAWDKFTERLPPVKPAFPTGKYQRACFAGADNSSLKTHLNKLGIRLAAGKETSNLLIVDGAEVTSDDLIKSKKMIDKIQKDGGMVLVMLPDGKISGTLNSLLPAKVKLTARRATALECDEHSDWGRYFGLPDLYFAEMEGDRDIQKAGLSGDFVKGGKVVLTASRTDWSLFNNSPENKKCAQVVLYEHLQKPDGAALVTHPFGNATLVLSALDYTLDTKETSVFWKTLYQAMGIGLYESGNAMGSDKKKEHDLLMDGPVD